MRLRGHHDDCPSSLTTNTRTGEYRPQRNISRASDYTYRAPLFEIGQESSSVVHQYSRRSYQRDTKDRRCELSRFLPYRRQL